MRARVTSQRITAAAALAAAQGLSSAAQAEIAVVVTSKPVHALVATVMGATGKPALLVSSSASPHTYAMKPSDAKAVNSARVFFRVSEDLEPFTAKLVKSLPSSVQVETLADAKGLRRMSKREGGAFDGHAAHAGHKSKATSQPEPEEIDTHLWLDPGNAGVLVQRIAAVLSEVEPANAARFQANAEAFVVRNTAMAADLRRDLKPLAGRPFIVFHDAYQYFESWAGLAAAGSITTSPEVQPTGKRLSTLRAKIKGSGVACVFAEPQFQPKVVAALTEGFNVRTGTLDPEGTMLEPGPELYERLMRDLARNFAACLSP
jgi:zinc transport system substrate-binding protein